MSTITLKELTQKLKDHNNLLIAIDVLTARISEKDANLSELNDELKILQGKYDKLRVDFDDLLEAQPYNCKHSSDVELEKSKRAVGDL